MDDKEMEIVRQNILRSEERKRERRFQLRHEFRRHSDLLDSIDIAQRIAQVGMVLSAIWIFRTASVWGGISAVVCVILGTIGIGLIYYLTPFVGGMAAHFWFCDSAVPTRHATIGITLLIETACFGWIVWITS